MKSRPFFSIAIPTYNRAEDLRRAVSSVLRQGFSDFEIVVSDNASVDDTRKTIESFGNRRIQYFRNKHHVSVQQNIQNSIRRANGKYIFLLGDDDILLSGSVLANVHTLLKKRSYGVVRVNYISLSPDKKAVFDFRVSKYFTKDETIGPHGNPDAIVKFIREMDPSFLSGIVLKNDLPDRIKILHSELISWFPFLYYLTEKAGAAYVNAPGILASWSVWRPAINQVNPLYSLMNGKLSAEDYYREVKKHLDATSYGVFLRMQLFGTYVNLFPAAKYFTGNANLLQLARRVRELDPGVAALPRYWVYLGISLLMPGFILGYIRSYALRSRIMHMGIETQEVREGYEYYMSL